MTGFLATRTDQLTRKGRPMFLRRRSGTEGAIVYTLLQFQGYKMAYRADQVDGTAIIAGDAQVEMLSTELAAGFLAMPSIWNPAAPLIMTDRVMCDGADWTIKGVEKLYDGTQLIGFSLWVRGG